MSCVLCLCLYVLCRLLSSVFILLCSSARHPKVVNACPQAENKVKQEAEARRRAEEQAKKAAAAQAALAMHSQQSMGTGGADYSMRGPMNKGMSKAVSH